MPRKSTKTTTKKGIGGSKPATKTMQKKIQSLLSNFTKDKYADKVQTEALEKEMNPEEYKQFKEDANDSLDTKAETKTILDSIDEGVLLHSMTPSQYFRKIKELQVSINSDTLQDTINVASDILDKLRRSGQKPLAEKLMRKITVLIKERDAVLAGFSDIIKTNDLYVWIHEIEVREKDGESVSPIKVVNLEDYMRVIPDDVLVKLEAAKSTFDKFYIVFTDYTGETERHVEEEKKDKDPILFGAFLTPRDNGRMGPADHLFFIADWEDEYCDLTLSQMIESFKNASGQDMLVVPDEMINAQMDEIKKEFNL